MRVALDGSTDAKVDAVQREDSDAEITGRLAVANERIKGSRMMVANESIPKTC
jgi:hypothetical protein